MGQPKLAEAGVKTRSKYTPEPNNQRPPDRVPFQFGLGRLFVLMTAYAGLLAVVASMNAPVWFRLGVALYLMFMAAYVILRIPHIYRVWKRTGRRREELEALLCQTRAKTKESDDDAAQRQPKTPTTPGRHQG